MKDTIRIATRQSALALWQANHIKYLLEQKHPDLTVELLGITTSGDKQTEGMLMGGKGLFVKELEQALLDHQADIAVHSMKDVPMEFPAGLGIPVICERADPRDVLVAKQYSKLAELPAGSVLGTSSLRRTSQLQALRTDLKIEVLRGNVDTRLKKLAENNYDAIVLAAAGLIRLGLQDRITEYLSTDICLPGAGQGALGIECRLADEEILNLIKFLNHEPTQICVRAERALCTRLQGSCQVPIGAYAVLEKNQIRLFGLVGKPDGSVILRVTGISVGATGGRPEQLGIKVAEDLLQQGAAEILCAY